MNKHGPSVSDKLSMARECLTKCEVSYFVEADSVDISVCKHRDGWTGEVFTQEPSECLLQYGSLANQNWTAVDESSFVPRYTFAFSYKCLECGANVVIAKSTLLEKM